MTVFSYESYFSPTAEQKAEIENWPPLLASIAKQEKAGFTIDEVTFYGCGYIGANEKRKLLGVMGRCFYRLPNGAAGSYGLGFQPEAASLLVVFKVKTPQNTTRHYVVMVEQPRIGSAMMGTLEPPSGILDHADTFSPQSIRDVAVREFAEEAFKLDAKSEPIPLGSALCIHPAMADYQYPFLSVVETNEAAFSIFRNEYEGKRGGIASEGEFTTIRIMEIRDAYRALVEQCFTWPLQPLSRYMLENGLIDLK